MSESLFNKAADIQACNLIQKTLQHKYSIFKRENIFISVHFCTQTKHPCTESAVNPVKLAYQKESVK